MVMKMNTIKQSFMSKTTKQGSYSIGITGMVIAIILVINLIAGQLPESIRQIDISTNKIYEITDTTVNILAALDKDITLTVLADKETTDARIKNFISKYVASSGHLSVDWIDPILHPSALTTYNAERDSIVVSCPETGKSANVLFSDILLYDEMSYYMYGTYTVTDFDAEGQLTSAVNYVTSDTSKVIYTTSGHGEGTLSTSVTDLLDKSGLSNNDINLMMETALPEDCDMLFLNAPAKDITADELTIIQDYLTAGGKVFYIQSDQADETPNLDTLLTTYGMAPADGYVADLERCYQGNYYYLLPVLSTGNSLNSGLVSDMVLMINAKGLTETEPARDTISVSPFITTSGNAYAISESGETPGTYWLGAVATEGEGQLTVLTSPYLIEEGITSQFSNLENLNLFMNAVTGNFEDISNISIEPKSLTMENNTMAHAGLIGLVLMVGVPLLFVLFGLAKWLKRRKA